MRVLPFAAIGAMMACALTAAPAAQASTVVLTMDEVATAPLDGLAVTKGGVTFTFSDPAGNLFYNSGGPGTITYVQDPSVQGGGTDTFSVSFSQAVTSISFGLAELNTIALTGVDVILSNGSHHPFDLLLTDPFSEGQFNWTGGPVTGFTVIPNANAAAIAFDNLSITTGVPEPGIWALLLLGFAGVGAAARRRPAKA